MAQVYEGRLSGEGRKFGIVVSRFNDFITKELLAGCLQELGSLKVKSNDITTIWVPGSFEIPVAALKLAKKKNIDGVICLGAIIRGETIHFDLIAQAAALGVAQASVATGKPVIFGVLATQNLEQAYKRSGRKGENKGIEAARNAVEMVNLLKEF